jgi:hypothetical protein
MYFLYLINYTISLLTARPMESRNMRCLESSCFIILNFVCWPTPTIIMLRGSSDNLTIVSIVSYISKISPSVITKSTLYTCLLIPLLAKASICLRIGAK